MFSGIIEELGKVAGVSHKKNLSVLKISTRKIRKGLKLGDSVAVNGTCLTISKIEKHILSFDLMKETLEKTTLGLLNVSDPVNLERALAVSDRLSGHFVTGHTDNMCRIKNIVSLENYLELQIELKKDLRQYIVPKGSVSVDGVSLTVGKVAKDYFSVYLIPFTLKVTNLGIKKTGDSVNIETDVLAKYILNKK